MKSENTVWHQQSVSRLMRERQYQQRGKVLWYTGLSGSGKSTLANAVDMKLHQIGKHSYVIDGDNLRQGLNQDLGFSDSDRVENIRRVAELSKLFVDAGLIVSTAFISPFRSERDYAKRLIGEKDFIEIFIDTPLEICEERDPKGLYKKARAGEISNFTGIDSSYEAPLSPDLHVRYGEADITDVINNIVSKAIV